VIERDCYFTAATISRQCQWCRSSEVASHSNLAQLNVRHFQIEDTPGRYRNFAFDRAGTGCSRWFRKASLSRSKFGKNPLIFLHFGFLPALLTLKAAHVFGLKYGRPKESNLQW
jgi:hypothetical protein